MRFGAQNTVLLSKIKIHDYFFEKHENDDNMCSLKLHVFQPFSASSKVGVFRRHFAGKRFWNQSHPSFCTLSAFSPRELAGTCYNADHDMYLEYGLNSLVGYLPHIKFYVLD